MTSLLLHYSTPKEYTNMEPNYQPSLTTASRHSQQPRELTSNVVVVSSYDALIDATSLLDDFRISYRVDYMEDRRRPARAMAYHGLPARLSTTHTNVLTHIHVTVQILLWDSLNRVTVASIT